jgi:O-antigen/teichoic acid export membrane protein
MRAERPKRAQQAILYPCDVAKSRAWQAAVNGLVALGGNLGTIVLGLACTPFIVAALGLPAYGLWALYGSITVYFTLTDFGLGATFVKSIAEYHELGHAQRVRQVITFGLLFYLVLGAIVVPLVALAAPAIDSLFNVGPQLAEVAPRLLVAIVTYAALSSAFNVFGQALIGFHLMRKSSIAGFWGSATFYAFALVLLSHGLGIDALIVATFARLAVQTAQTYYQARRAFGPLFCNPMHLELAVIRPQFKMGAWIQVMNVCSTITNEAGRVVVGAFVSVADVSYFDLAMRLTRQARALPMNFSNALLPGMSALDAAGNGDRLAGIYAQTTRYFMFATALLMGGIAACAFPLMTVWMGRGFEPAAIVAMLLAAAFFVSNLSIV